MGIIIVAEDDLTTRKALCLILERIGRIPVACCDGLVAQQLVEENASRVSLVITDVVMPSMDGRALLKWMQANDRLRRIPVIIQSAYLSLDAADELIDAGAAAVLLKPIDRVQLEEWVNTLAR